MNPSIQLCVFAYNLEPTIVGSLRSLLAACGRYPVQVFVMVNGCRDHTLSRVEDLARACPQIIPVNLAMGDKANAWNTFVYDYYDRASVAVFADGDLTFADLAVAALVDYFLAHPVYNSVSGFPCAGGRSSKIWRAALLREHQFTGNLYLLAPAFLQQIIDRHVRLPTGLIGDDSMLGFLSATSLCSGKDTPRENIGVCQAAVFNYESLNPLSWRDIRLYWRRRIRYSMRHFQQAAIVPMLKREGIGAMPQHAWQIDRARIRWFGTNLLFDLLALREIHRDQRTHHDPSR